MKNEQQLAKIMRVATDAIFLFQTDGRVAFVNDAGEHLCVDSEYVDFERSRARFVFHLFSSAISEGVSLMVSKKVFQARSLIGGICNE